MLYFCTLTNNIEKFFSIRLSELSFYDNYNDFKLHSQKYLNTISTKWSHDEYEHFNAFKYIDCFHRVHQHQIQTLQAVISQTLFTRSDRPGMVPAVETLLCTPAVRNLIRENKIFEIPNVIETSRAIGMCSLDGSIAELYFNGTISKEDAIAKAVFPDKLERQLVA